MQELESLRVALARWNHCTSASEAYRQPGYNSKYKANET